MSATPQALRTFQGALNEYYGQYGRHDMQWRQPEYDSTFDPYKIMVSEVMLQQTQVSRVAKKYVEFMGSFPTVSDLAVTPLGDVLTLWSGLGYNRRAKFLWQAAQMVTNHYGGVFPKSQAELQKLPGIGSNTAGAIMAYAYNRPVLFVETNIRTVIIHHFYDDHSDVTDSSILEILAEVLPMVTAEKDTIAATREFYWAMMDYGAFLKKTVGNKNRASKTYSKQSTFKGSKRQVRGHILRLLIGGGMLLAELEQQIQDERFNDVLDGLLHEQLVRVQNDTVHLG